MATVTTRSGVTHEETCGSLTACGRRIGSERQGWIKEGRLVTCRGCAGVRALADAWLAAVSTLDPNAPSLDVRREGGRVHIRRVQS